MGLQAKPGAGRSPRPWVTRTLGLCIAFLPAIWGCGGSGEESTLADPEGDGPGGTAAGRAAADTAAIAHARWPGFPLLPDGRFPLSAWCAPPNRETTDQRYREYAEAGFTVVLPALEDPYLEKPNLERLEVAWRQDLFVILRDDTVHPDEAIRPGWGTRVDEAVRVYSGHPAFLSYFLADEPAPEIFPSLAALNRRFARRDSLHPAYVNMLGLSPAGYGHHGLAYHRFLGSFLEEVEPAFFSIDIYSLTSEGDFPNFCPGLDSVRLLAARHRIPFWVILQLTPHRDFRELTAAELAWQANLALAYGAKGIVWFTYWTPRPDEQGFRLGPIAYEGERTASYDRVAKLNPRIEILGRELSGFVSREVLHVGELPRDGRPLPPEAALGGTTITLKSGGDLTVALFELDARASLEPPPQGRRLMLVNRDYRRAAEYELTSPGRLRRWLGKPRRYSDPLGPEAGEGLHHLSRLDPGEAALFSVEP
jgi:hypothetical protein